MSAVSSNFSNPVDLNLNLDGYESDLSDLHMSTSSLPSTVPFPMAAAPAANPDGSPCENPPDIVRRNLDYIEKMLH